MGIGNKKVDVNEQQKIYLDTSAAMNFVGFKKFVKQAEKSLRDAEKKIIVLKVVWLELIRNYNSTNKDKAEAANQAISILSSHRDIFEIEDEEIFQYEMESAFADKVLLSSIILDRTDASILLITNDRMLSKDALEINHQSSCRGHKITTGYIDNNGDLLPGYASEMVEDIEPEIVVKEVIKVVKVPSEKEEDWFAKIAIPVGTLVAGLFIGKYSDKIVNVIKSVA